MKQKLHFRIMIRFGLEITEDGDGRDMFQSKFFLVLNKEEGYG